MHKTWKKNSCAFKLYCPVLNPRHICVKKDIWETFELPCLNSPAENKDENGVKKWGEYFPV